MPMANIEIFLARLCSDEKFLKQFLDVPESTLLESQFSDLQKASLLSIDKSDLLMAFHSFNHKRDGYKKRKNK